MEMTPIGIVRSCFEEKFGTPRQPGLAAAATAELILLPPFQHPDCLRGLEGCSHVWLLFLFHRSADQGWTPTVRPPRLGGNRRLGVFATRSPFRPNPIGLSVVELAGLIDEPGRRGLRLRNHDLVDGTPVLDIKPYIPYADCVAHARPPAGFERPPPRLPVSFAPAALQACAGQPGLRELIVDSLSLDPRPAYRQGQGDRTHGVALAGHNVRWRVVAEGVEVVSIERADESVRDGSPPGV